MTQANPIVAGCVVLYECGTGIGANLATYAGDLDRLLVLDNSAERDPAVAAAVAAHGNAEYVFNGANLGIAAALNLAVDWARARGADFLLTMDQDSSFDAVPFRIFRDRVLSLPFLADLAIAGPSFLDEQSPSSAIVDSTTVITSGSIVSLANQARIGAFDERLFIDEVDHDYCLRAHDLRLRVVTLPDVRLEHRLGQSSTASILGRTVRWNVHAPIRHYYMVRNGLYMMSKHRQCHLGYSLRRLARLSRTVAAALLLAPQRRERFGLVAQGVRDYLAERMGARNDTKRVADARGTS
jgi:rhamnosyltransferase